jgi:hypothetical protein
MINPGLGGTIMNAEIHDATQVLLGAARDPENGDSVESPPVDESDDVTGAVEQYDIDDGLDDAVGDEDDDDEE